MYSQLNPSAEPFVPGRTSMAVPIMEHSTTPPVVMVPPPGLVHIPVGIWKEDGTIGFLPRQFPVAQWREPLPWDLIPVVQHLQRSWELPAPAINVSEMSTFFITLWCLINVPPAY